MKRWIAAGAVLATATALNNTGNAQDDLLFIICIGQYYPIENSRESAADRLNQRNGPDGVYLSMDFIHGRVDVDRGPVDDGRYFVASLSPTDRDSYRVVLDIGPHYEIYAIEMTGLKFRMYGGNMLDLGVEMIGRCEDHSHRLRE